MPDAFPFVILFKGAKCAFDLPGFSEVQNAHLIFAPVQQKAFSAIVEFFRFWASFLIRGHTAHGTKMSYDIGSLSMDYSNRMTGLYGISCLGVPLICGGLFSFFDGLSVRQTGIAFIVNHL